MTKILDFVFLYWFGGNHETELQGPVYGALEKAKILDFAIKNDKHEVHVRKWKNINL